MARVPANKEAFGDEDADSEHLLDHVAKQVTVHNVHFYRGAKNKMHIHTGEQVLYCLEGKGIVATETESWEVEPGDIVFVPPLEKHWHGAAPGQDFVHLSINMPGKMIVV
ncbi:MAG: cupin domain-containing protein [Chloroflexi bacterium]|nr:cupin domain-containing protein [Chloroflexota bacterium]